MASPTQVAELAEYSFYEDSMMRPHEQLYPDSELAEPLKAERDDPYLSEASAEQLFDEITRRSLQNATNEDLLDELQRRFPASHK